MTYEPELAKLCFVGMDRSMAMMSKHWRGTPEYNRSRKIYMSLFEHLDINDNPIPEKYRTFYHLVRRGALV